MPDGLEASDSCRDAAALLGRQPLHTDAPEPEPGKRRAEDLPSGSKPLSIIVAIEPDTKLWIFPDGCDHPETGILVELAVGDALVWNMDVVHAGAGYALMHHRIHTYVDVHLDLYIRKPGETNPCPRRKLFGSDDAIDDDSVDGDADAHGAAAARSSKRQRPNQLDTGLISDSASQLAAASFYEGGAEGEALPGDPLPKLLGFV